MFSVNILPATVRLPAEKRTGLLGLPLGAALGALLIAAAIGQQAAGDEAAGPWLSGGKLQQRLARPVDIYWPDWRLREAIEGLSRTQQVAVLIDRRVDPGQKISLTLQGSPLAAALQEIARREELGCCLLGPVAYFGPPRIASQLRTLAALRADEISRLPHETAKPLLLSKAMAWSDFATPRELLSQLAREAGLRLSGLEQVPHDLWAAADLPPLSLSVRLTLVAVQFDLTFRIVPETKTIDLVPLPDEVALVRSYDGGREPHAVAKRYAALVPHAQIKVVGDKVWVKGLLEEHEQIAAPRLPAKRPATSPAGQRGEVRIFEFSVQEAPAERVLQEVAKQLNLELKIDREALRAAGVSLERRISVSVRNVSVDELLQEVARAAKLQIRRQGDVLEIGPAK
jgi:hypothetical protein